MLQANSILSYNVSAEPTLNIPFYRRWHSSQPLPWKPEILYTFLQSFLSSYKYQMLLRIIGFMDFADHLEFKVTRKHKHFCVQTGGRGGGTYSVESLRRS
jgi:hypothetical protein